MESLAPELLTSWEGKWAQHWGKLEEDELEEEGLGERSGRQAEVAGWNLGRGWPREAYYYAKSEVRHGRKTKRWDLCKTRGREF